MLAIFEDGVPPRFRLYGESGLALAAETASVETIRPDGSRQIFHFEKRREFLESLDEIPEPHEFAAQVRLGNDRFDVAFKEHSHENAASHRDNNLRAAVVHVLADAAVSVLVIIGLLLARSFGWIWMDPLAGIVGACVIASWSYGLIRDTGAILLDMTPDKRMAENVRQAIEREGDQVADLHLWRLGPGHVGAIVSVITRQARGPAYYRACLAAIPSLSHLTIEVQQAG